MLDRYVLWGNQSFVSALSGLAAFLSGECREVTVACQYAGNENYHWADHPDVNSNWRSGSITLSFDSGEVPRTEKTKEIVTNQTALNHLRVCWKANDVLNCSRCEKCLRTMAAIEAVGYAGSAVTFQWPLQLELITNLQMEHPAILPLWEENLALARETDHKLLVEAIERAIKRARF